MNKRLFHILILVAATLQSYAQNGLTGVDINNGPNGSYPVYLTPFGNKIFCYANKSNGWEPFAGDAISTPVQLADINPGLPDAIKPNGSIKPACTVNGSVYFSADNGSVGRELYKYDGTNTPTLVLDLEAGSGGSFPDNMVTLNNQLYFRARTSTNGYELWTYSPTTMAPQMLTDINPGADSSITGNVTVFNNAIYYTAKTPARGNELHMYNAGLTIDTIVADIYPGAGSGDPKNLIVINNKLYFSANDGNHGRELYVYDGTNAPQRLTDLNASFLNTFQARDLPLITAMNGKIYFAGTADNSNYHIYCYDPATGNTTLAAKTNNQGSSEPTWLTAYDGKIYFNAADSAAHFDLWRYDGNSTPNRVADLCTNGSNPEYLTVLGNDLYFSANGCNTIGQELFAYNAAASVTKIVNDMDIQLYPNPAIDKVNLEISGADNMLLRLTVMSVDGRILYRDARSSSNGKAAFTIQVESWSGGIYLYHLSDPTGKIYATGRFVKQ